MKRPWPALAAAVFVAVPAAAIDVCDQPGKLAELAQRTTPWESAFWEKRFDDLDRHLNRQLAAVHAGTLSDAEAHRAFAMFESAEPGREPLHIEWIRTHPRSGAAFLALGYHYMQRWIAADNEADLRAAMKALDFAEERMQNASLVLAARIRIAAERRAAARLDAGALYASAIQRYPRSLQATIQFIRASAPKRGGSLARLERIGADASALPEAERRYVQYLTYQEMGAAMEDARDDKRAAGFYERSLPLCPGLPKTRVALGRVLAKLGRYQELVAMTTGHIAAHPRDAWGFTTRGLAFRELGKYPDAFADYDRAVQLGDAAALEGLAWFFETGTYIARDRRKALDLYELAGYRGVEGARAKADKLRPLVGPS